MGSTSRGWTRPSRTRRRGQVLSGSRVRSRRNGLSSGSRPDRQGPRPCHSPECVKAQLSDGNTGFVKNFLATRKDKQGNAVEIPDEYRDLVMGYYTGRHLPVYDHLARNYCVCDHWHDSIPGDTWPNRLYSLAATTSESVGHKLGSSRLQGALDREATPQYPGLRGRGLHPPPRRCPMALVLPRPGDPSRGRCALPRSASSSPRQLHLFQPSRVSFATEAAESLIDARDNFLDDAAKNELRDVSWIDPNFIDLERPRPELQR